MKRVIIKCFVLAVTVFLGLASFAQKNTETNTPTYKNIPEMKTYLIEREIPDAGKLTPEQLKSISQKSCAVLKDMGPQIQWVHSYVTGSKIYCIYKADNEALLREHAKKGGFPANFITQISSTINPRTAD